MAAMALSSFTYNLLTHLRGVALCIASLWSKSKRSLRRARSDWQLRLARFMSENTTKPTFWCHLITFEDYEQCAPIIRTFEKAHPGWNYIITFQDPMGLTLHRLFDETFYTDILPNDTPKNVKRFLSIASPTVAIMLSQRHMGNFLRALQKGGIPTYLVAAKCNAKSPIFKRRKHRLRRWLHLYTWIFTIDTTTVDLLSRRGITHVTCAGDMIFDKIAQAISVAKPIAALEDLASQGGKLIVANCTTEKDEAALLPLVWNLPPQWRLVVIPNEVNEERIVKWLNQVNRGACLASKHPSKEELARCVLFLLDAPGQALSAYRHAAIAYVGGGFENQLADVFEPAAFGIPIVFGARHHNRPDAVLLREHNAAAAAYAPAQLATICLSLMGNVNIRTRMGERADDFFTQHVGSTDAILRRIEADILLTNVPYEST